MASNNGEDKKNNNKNPFKPINFLNDKALSSESKQITAMNLLLKKASASAASEWDPFVSIDWEHAGPPGPLASTRIKRDITALYKDPLPGIFTIPDETNICMVNCLIVGPFDTPYEGGFFHFGVRFGPSYPLHPPRVRFLTTDRGKVRFNPNLYANGKVCLSILGTWSGPAWSPASNLGSLLLSIQSLLNENPYYNEPGFQVEHCRGESQNYNNFISHETIRVSVCSQLESLFMGKSHELRPISKEFISVIKTTFLDFYDHYLEVCNKHRHLDGTEMKDLLFTLKNNKFNFENLITRLKILKERLMFQEFSDDNGAGGRDTPLSSMSENSEESTSSTHVKTENTFSSSEKNEIPTSAAVISEANEFALCEEDDGSSLNESSPSLHDASGTSSHSGVNSGHLSDQFCDQWLYEDNDNDKELENDLID